MYAEIISVTENSALLAFATGRAGFVSLELEGLQPIHSVEAADCGRLKAEKLTPNTSYSGLFRSENNTFPIAFQTLPMPVGPELDRILLTADWHISTKPENRKGRFFIESAMLAQENLETAVELGATAILISGDLTNMGTPEEYEILAGILKNSPVPVLAVPGNHDHPEHGHWEKSIGKRTFRAKFPGGTILGIDTSDYHLNSEDAKTIERELDQVGRVTILSHYQLFEAPGINHKPELNIKNAAEFPRLFKKLTASNSTIWCGHQNICARSTAGKIFQLNLPQIPQWPCGSLLLRRYRNGVWYTFVPVRSEAMRQWSRTAGASAAAFYNEPQWLPEYRFAEYSRCNFFKDYENS